MSDSLEFTGERFVPEQVREIWYEHWHRYVFAASFVRGRRVLDCACGEGYGSELLARSAGSVTGVDLDEAAIAHARERYGARDNLAYRAADCTRLPFEDDRFDAIVSFETVEHIEAQAAMLAEFDRVLKPEGLLLISSPDKATYSDVTGFDNPFHVRELYREEFESLVGRHFPAIRGYGQKLVFHSAIWPLEKSGETTQVATYNDGRIENAAAPGHRPLYFILAAAREDRWLPDDERALRLFDDRDESVYAHYNAEIRHHIDSGVEFERMKARIRELEQAPESGQRPDAWWKRWFRKIK